MNIKVSVIIPVFNSIEFIRETLLSVYNQTYSNIEIICIDDGSTDGSFEFLKSLDWPHIKVEKNIGKGACAARNYGFELSTGDYIQFLDADDLISEEKIEKQIKGLKHLKNYISVCSTVHFYDTISNGHCVDKPFLFTTDQPKQLLINLYGGNGRDHNMVQTSAWLTPRVIIERNGLWDESLSKDQDGEFFCRVVANSNGVVYEDTVFNYYRKHINGDNIANKKESKYLESQLRALESKMKELNSTNASQAYKNAFALQYKILGIDAYPDYKILSNAALNKSKNLGGSSYMPVLGGNLIEFTKKMFGWKTAKLFKLFLHRLKKTIYN